MTERRAFESLLFLALVSGCINADPCTEYVPIWMENGQRSSDFYSKDVVIPLCDSFLENDVWYRFDHDAGNRLIEKPVEPSHCGTEAPIWLNGTHPTDSAEKTAVVCATYSSQQICGWNGTVRIRLCYEFGSRYFVYLLAVPPGCPLAYCVDGASRRQCAPPLLWSQEEFKCAEQIKTSTLAPDSASVAPTEPPSPGWGPWGPWSDCEKNCDYSLQFRRRKCGQLPCKGNPTDAKLCAQSNCQELTEEKDKGIVLSLKSANAKQDTLYEVLNKKPRIKEIMRTKINRICSRNSTLCCRFKVESISSEFVEYVTSNHIYVAKGYPKRKLEGNVHFKIIAKINRTHCGRTRQVRSADPIIISFDVMNMAAAESNSDMKAIGLVIEGNIDPATLSDDYQSESSPCPTATCIVPIVICCTIIFATVIVVGIVLHMKNKSKKTPEPTYEKPPDVAATNMIHPYMYIREGQTKA